MESPPATVPWVRQAQEQAGPADDDGYWTALDRSARSTEAIPRLIEVLVGAVAARERPLLSYLVRQSRPAASSYADGRLTHIDGLLRRGEQPDALLRQAILELLCIAELRTLHAAAEAALVVADPRWPGARSTSPAADFDALVVDSFEWPEATPGVPGQWLYDAFTAWVRLVRDGDDDGLHEVATTIDRRLMHETDRHSHSPRIFTELSTLFEMCEVARSVLGRRAEAAAASERP